MSPGFFITFEGPDGSGKSTQLRLLAAALTRMGEAITVTRQPGGTAFGDKVRALLLDSRTSALDPRAEMALLFADRAQAIAEVIRPAIKRGDTVLCDRWTDSTEAYQGGGRGESVEVIHGLHGALCAGLQPDLTVLLLPPLEQALARARRRNERVAEQTGHDENRFESESDLFHGRVFAQYRAIAEREPARVAVVDGAGSIEGIHSVILDTVKTRLARHRARV